MKSPAIAAHPEDSELMLAVTPPRLEKSEREIHIWNLADGCQRTEVHPKAGISITLSACGSPLS